MPPFFFNYDERGVLDYYRAMSEESEGLPLIVYAAPMAGPLLPVSTIEKMLDIPGFIGMKFTNPNYYLMSRYKKIDGGNINIFNGPDETCALGLMMGADGAIGSTYNLMPRTFVAIYNAVQSGDMETAMRLQHKADDLIEALLDYNVVEAIKVGLTLKGYDVGEIDMTVGTSYTAVGEALSAGSADLGFISGGNYVLFSDDCDVLLTALRYAINKDSENPADWNDGTIEENTEDMSTYYRCILLAGPSEKGQELLSKVNAGEELTWDDLNSATWAVLNPTSASGYIYPSLWLQEHYGKGISDLDNVVECDSHTTSVARLAAGQVDVMVSYGHIRIKNAPIWESDFGGTAPMVEQTGVIGVTDGIYNDMIAYSKTSDTMADEAFRQAVGESFIELAQTEEGQEIFGVFSQVGYDWGSDSDYDGERAAQALLKSMEA